MQKLDTILKEFLGTDDLRPKMMKPHFEEGSVIATDAHILIVAPEKYFAQKVEPQELFLKYKAVIPPHDKNKPLYEIDNAEFWKVYKNIPTEPLFETCKKCAGEGTEECDLGYDHDCNACNGSGDSKKIIGRQVMSKHAIQIDEASLKPDYLKLIIQVAELVNQKATIIQVKETQANIFYVDDIMILLMPYQNPQETYILPVKGLSLV